MFAHELQVLVRKIVAHKSEFLGGESSAEILVHTKSERPLL